MKKTLTLLFAAIFAGPAFALPPSGTVTGRLYDASDSSAVVGAVIEWSPAKSPAQKKYTTSAAGGAISITVPSYGDYQVVITSMGYIKTERKVTVNAATASLGRIYLKPDAKSIEGITVAVQAIRTSQKGDTVSYDAQAFKVARDADAEGLLTKLPGVRVVDGQVEAQGETVRKVFVDGKEFFGQDVNAAIKNLPAEAIAKIEVYNKQSDQAEFTGVDDGQGYKAINIVTKTDMRQGQFGKLYAGWGNPDQYIAGGNVNIFSGGHRWSLIGLSNNMNQQNFLNEDIMGVMGGGGRGGWGRGRGFMVPQQSGISTVSSFGVNYNGEWGKKVTFQGSYFFNTSDNENESRTDREYISPAEEKYLKDWQTRSGSTNYNNRFSARLEWKPSDNHSFMYRPSLSFQNNRSDSFSWINDGYGTFADGLLDTYVPYSRTADSTRYKSSGYNIGNSLLYRIKLGKPGRTLSLDGTVTISRSDNDNYDESLTSYEGGIYPDSVMGQHKVRTSDAWNMRASIMYTEPITKHAQINAQYRFSYNDSPSDLRTYLWDREQERYFADEDPARSNIYNSYYTTHSIGPGFNYSVEGKTTLTASVSYQRSTLDGKATYPSKAKIVGDFNNVVYFGMLHRTFSPNNTLRIFLRSSTDNPSVKQLQDVPDITNAQSASSGNPSLKPSYEHSLYLNYNRSMTSTGRTLMVMLGGSLQNNYIADSLMQLTPGQEFRIPGSDIVMSHGGQYSRPVNVDGYRSLRGMVSFGTPVTPIRCNLNVNAGMDYSRMPSYINGPLNITSTYNYNGGATLSSNISENLDFTLRYNAGYNIAGNSVNERSDSKYLNQKAEGTFKWVIWGGLTFSANATYIKYSGISDDFTEEYCLVNALVGKKIFRNQRGEINCGVNDILDQNRSYSHSLNSQYIQNDWNLTKGRYFGINFIYNLRNFGKRKPGAEAGGQGGGRQFMGPGAGGPPPGGGFGRPF